MGYNQKHEFRNKNLPNSKINITFLSRLIIVIPSLYVTNQVYKSLKGQMFLLQDFIPINSIFQLIKLQILYLRSQILQLQLFQLNL